MGFGSLWHWLIVLAVVILIFGTRKLGNFGKDLGDAVKGFKEALRDNEAKPKLEESSGTTVEGEARKTEQK